MIFYKSYCLTSIFILLSISIISCNKEIKRDYKVIYLVKLNSYKVGYCFKYKNIKECNIYFYANNKKINFKTKLKKEDKKYYYSDLEFKRVFKTDKQVYPFLFDNFNKNDKIYYPKESLEIPISELGIKKIKNGYIALPFTYIKVDKIPKLDSLDIKKIRSFKVKKIKEDYLMNMKVEIKSDYLPPSDLRQKCTLTTSNKIICNLYRGSHTSTTLSNHTSTNTSTNSPKLEKFIKKYNIKKGDNLIPNLINALHKEIKYKDVSKKNDTEIILKNKEGDCTEFSHVAKDSLLFLGIKAKKVYGLLYQNNKFVYHSWVEYSKDKETYAFDPTLKRVTLTPNYITLTRENSYGVMIMPLIEDIKIISP